MNEQALSQEPICIGKVEFDEDKLREIVKEQVARIEITAEQEPCDAVSREAVIDAIERVRNNHAYDEIEEIQKLPSVNPQPCDDVVSRQAVDNYIVELLSGYLYAEERERLEKLSAYLWELPSVTLQPCDDAISRDFLFRVLDNFCGHDRTATITLDTLADIVYELPSVTQKSGKCLNKDDFIYALRTCGFSVHNGQVMYAEEDLIKRFDELLSITPHKSGKWIKVKSGDKDFPESIVCSRCSNENSHLDFNENAEPIGKVFVTSKFCPNCGAKMVEPQERSDKE